MSKLGPEEQQRYQEGLQSGEIMTPEQIQKYINKEYKDIAEIESYHALEYLKRKLNVYHEFYKGWKDGLIAGREIYYCGIVNGQPYMERVNPEYFKFEKCADLEFIHDAAWCCRKMVMSATDIYDRFYDKMTEKQLNDLLELIEDKPGAGYTSEIRKTNMDYESMKMHRVSPFTDNPFDSDHINVWHCCWKSFKKIGFVSVIDPESGEVEEYQVDEDYKVTGMEQSVEWKWIVEVWEGYRIGDSLYLGIEPLAYQHVSADNPNSQRLPYTGVIYNNTNSKPRSLVSMLKPLQYMYIVVWYRLELAMSRDKGKVALIDVTQIPKSMGIDVGKWMHYLSALGVAFINPAEEGWDVPGREGGRTA
jgi:DNA-directed RNA polymerase subunit N (RpoN/RPB10)